MVQVTLKWFPKFEIGQLHKLELLQTRTFLPAIPLVGQTLQIAAYAIHEGQKNVRLAGYYAFTVEEIIYYWESPHQPPEVEIMLTPPEYDESEILEVLQEIYGWEAVR